MTFKLANLPLLPPDWHYRQLGEIAEIIDCLHVTPEYAKDGFPVVRVTDVKGVFLNLRGCLRVPPAVFDNFTRKARPCKGDIVFTRVGSYGASVLVPSNIPFCIGQNTTLIRPRIDSHYLLSVLQSSSLWQQIESAAVGSTQKTISLKSINALSIPICPDMEIEAISSFLGALDHRIALLHETNTTLEAIAQALFKSWFVDFDPVRAKHQGREAEGMDTETAALFPDGFEESELGLVPRGWRAGTLDQIAETVRSQAQPSELNSDTHYVGLEHIPRRCLSLANWGSAEELQSTKSCFSKGDILFGKLRPYFHKVVIAPFAGVCSTDILVCQSKQREYYGLVTMHLFSKTLIDYAERLSNGAKMPRTSWKDLAAYPIVLPPPCVAENYRTIVEPLFQGMLANVNQIQTLATLRDTLLPRLISGQLRLLEVEALEAA